MTSAAAATLEAVVAPVNVAVLLLLLYVYRLFKVYFVVIHVVVGAYPWSTCRNSKIVVVVVRSCGNI